MRRTPARTTLCLAALCAVLSALALPGVAMLVDSDGEAGDHLGLSGLAADYVSGPAVAVSGDMLVAGAPDDDAHGHVGACSVVVCRRQGGAWVLEQ
jgi:hypothetical protein